MIQPLQIFYQAGNLSAPQNNIARFKIPSAGKIKSINIWASFAPVSDAVFQVRLNGTALFADNNRPTILNSQFSAIKSNLDFNVIKGDTVSLDLQSIGAGGLNQPFYFWIDFDDLLHSQSETAFITTSINANAAADFDNLTIGKTFILTKVVADRACRVRLYSNSAARASDITRAPGTEPTGEHGVILDLVFTSGNLQIDLAPIVFGSDQKPTRNGIIPARIDNLTNANSTISLSFTKILIEV